VTPTASAAIVGLTVALGTATALWTLSVKLRDASVADIGWGPGFALLAWLYAAWPGAFGQRPVLVAVLLTMWGMRLGWHLYQRHRDEDPRYQAMRAVRGDSFWWRSLFIVFWLQAAILWFVALPVLAAARPPHPLATLDLIGALVFCAGFAFEAVADRQLARFRANPANRGRVLDTGLWRYTRHPNYFGDALLWWGIFIIACATPGGWWTAASPLAMTWLLLRVSGVTLLERTLKASKPGYEQYMRRTPAFVPWRPRS
jgi:steroid 5-alpha reductase family enzyme